MARPLRVEQVGCWHHVTARGNERKNIFRDDHDRRHFLEILQSAVEMFGLRLHAYVLMSNHYHLLMELTEPNLSRAVHWLNVSYTVWFNRRHRRSGHLLQGRFKSVAVEPERWSLELSRYIHLNPVRVSRYGLGKTDVQRSRAIPLDKVDPAQARERVAKLRSYSWSSYRAYIGAAPTPAWLTTETILRAAAVEGQPQRRYREYCEQAIRQGLAESPWDRLISSVVLGSERFAARIAASLKPGRAATKNLVKRPTFEDIIRAVEKVRGETWENFRDRYGDWGRDLALHLGRTQSGLSIRELSERAGIAYVSAAAALRRFSERAKTDPDLGRRIQEATTQMHNE